jgi:thiol-disulfide isomerase/thioredoxin
VNVDQLGGRLTVVNLWASWRSICRKEMAVLEAAHQSSDDMVQFVGVDTLDEQGQEVARHVGGLTSEDLRALLDKA